MFLSRLKNIASFTKLLCPYRSLPIECAHRNIYLSRNVGTGEDDCNKQEKEEVFMDPSCTIAIVTGGATGIGYAACCHLLCEGAKHVVIGGINRQEGHDAVHRLNDKFGRDKAFFMDCDVTDECAFDHLFTETKNLFGYVDILFNNAGMLEDSKWSQSIDVNVKGVLIGCFLAFKYMGRDQPGGRGGLVVNNASILGFDACPGCPVYNCSKHAVVGITKALGAEYHLHRTCVRVCTLCPGVTGTDLVHNAKGKQYLDEWGEETVRALSELPSQDIGVTGQAFMYVVRHGVSGEHYIIEGCKLFHAHIPHRSSFSTLKRNFKDDKKG